MKILRTDKGVTIELSTEEAGNLCTDLRHAFARVPSSFMYNVSGNLISGLKRAKVSPAVAAEAIEARIALLEMENVFDPKDLADLKYIAVLVRKGWLDAARGSTRNLDTAVRDEIPEIAWPLVGLHSL